MSIFNVGMLVDVEVMTGLLAWITGEHFVPYHPIRNLPPRARRQLRTIAEWHAHIQFDVHTRANLDRTESEDRRCPKPTRPRSASMLLGPADMMTVSTARRSTG